MAAIGWQTGPARSRTTLQSRILRVTFYCQVLVIAHFRQEQRSRFTISALPTRSTRITFPIHSLFRFLSVGQQVYSLFVLDLYLYNPSILSHAYTFIRSTIHSYTCLSIRLGQMIIRQLIIRCLYPQFHFTNGLTD